MNIFHDFYEDSLGHDYLAVANCEQLLIAAEAISSSTKSICNAAIRREEFAAVQGLGITPIYHYLTRNHRLWLREQVLASASDLRHLATELEKAWDVIPEDTNEGGQANA